MKDWLEEIIEQIAVGECLSVSGTKTGSRLGLIVVDNAVEASLISYIETYKQIVGGHILGGIAKAEWENTKRYFDKLLAYVVSKEAKLANLQTEIQRYHKFRSDLYHSGIPVTTSSTRVKAYSSLARQALNALFGIDYSDTEWDNFLLGKFAAIFVIRRRTSRLLYP